MELEVIRAAAAGASDLTIGVNAQIALLTIDTIGDLIPPTVAVYNYVDHPWVARKKLNIDEINAGRISVPALAIYLSSPPKIDGEIQRTDYRDGSFPVTFGYVSVEPDDAKRMRDALYTTRALLRFLTQFHKNDYADTLRSRNGISLILAQSPLEPATPMDSWEGGILAAELTVTYRCREHSP